MSRLVKKLVAVKRKARANLANKLERLTEPALALSQEQTDRILLDASKTNVELLHTHGEHILAALIRESRRERHSVLCRFVRMIRGEEGGYEGEGSASQVDTNASEPPVYTEEAGAVGNRLLLLLAFLESQHDNDEGDAGWDSESLWSSLPAYTGQAEEPPSYTEQTQQTAHQCTLSRSSRHPVSDPGYDADDEQGPRLSPDAPGAGPLSWDSACINDSDFRDNWFQERVQNVQFQSYSALELMLVASRQVRTVSGSGASISSMEARIGFVMDTDDGDSS